MYVLFVLNEKEANEQQILKVNKAYHDMHAEFLGREMESKYVLEGVQDHVNTFG
jgi:hypothetical protein